MAKNKKKEFDVLLDRVTSSFKLEADLGPTLEICDLINEQKCLAKHALTALDKKLFNQNQHVAYLALLVLESLEKNCGDLIHNEVVTEVYMTKLCHFGKRTKNKEVRKKVFEIIQSIDPRLSKKHSSDKRNILFIADKDYDCRQCDVPIKIGEEMRNCQSCGNVYCAFCALTFAEYDIQREGGVCDDCYSNNRVKFEPENIFQDFVSNLNQQNQGEHEDEIQTSCFSCQRNFEDGEQVSCEICRNLFCAKCSSKKVELPFTSGLARVCETCYVLQKGPPDPEPVHMDNVGPELPVILDVVMIPVEDTEPEGAAAMAPVQNQYFENDVEMLVVPQEIARALTPPPLIQPPRYLRNPAPRRAPNLGPEQPRFNVQAQQVNLSEDEQLQLAITLSLDERNDYIPEQEDIDVAIALSLSEGEDVQLEPRKEEEVIDEDTQLALALSSSKTLQEKKLEKSLALVFGGPKEEECQKCRANLSPSKRIKNCKACQKVFCNNCLIKTSCIPKFGMGNNVEVCNACYEVLRIALSLKSKLGCNEKPQKKILPTPPVDGKTCHKCRIGVGDLKNEDRCQGCGNLFCKKCLALSSSLPLFGIAEEVPVCETCFNFHREQKMRTAAKRFQVLEGENKQLNKKNKQLSQARECKICYENEVNVLFLPCKHAIVCDKCSHNLKECPVCRTTIESPVKIFF